MSDDKPRTHTILILDDDQFLLDMYTMKFKESGFTVIGVASGDEAVAQLRGGLIPDAILMDLVMPSMDGFDFLKKLKDEGLGQHSDIIILSNLGQPTDIERGKEFGIKDYIIKANATPSQVVERVLGDLKGEGGPKQ